MNTTEATRLCRGIASMAPAQRFDDETPAFWAVALTDTRYTDARDAAVTILRRQPFVAVADIVAEVRRIRLARLDGADQIEPNVDPDSPALWVAEKRAILAAVADGTLDGERYAAGGWTLTGAQPTAIGPASERPMPTLDGVFPRPPRPSVADYAPAATSPVVPREVTGPEAAAMEAERRRQLAALDAQDGAA